MRRRGRGRSRHPGGTPTIIRQCRDEGSSVQFLTKHKNLVSVSVGHGLPGTKAQLIALAKAIASIY